MKHRTRNMDNGPYKQITKNTYNSVVEDYADRDEMVIPETPDVNSALKEFVKLLSPHAKVLDVGCGAGRDSRVLAKNGLEVAGIDFSEKMIEAAKKKNSKVEYRLMDMEEISFPKNSFDGIWANASLHHIPKSRLPSVLQKICTILKNNGVFFLKVKLGDGEGIKEDQRFGYTIKRYFAFYKPEEMQDLLEKSGFQILSWRTTTNNKWLDVFAKK